jgi:flagellar biogenesis protein FliO
LPWRRAARFSINPGRELPSPSIGRRIISRQLIYHLVLGLILAMRLIALSVCVFALASPLLAENTPGPPDWNDGKKSVYAPAPPAQPPAAQPTSISTPIASAKVLDAKVTPAKLEQPVPANDSARYLAPPTARPANDTLANSNSRTNAPSRKLIDFGIPLQSIYTVATALAIVIGAFLLFAWALRGGSRSVRRRRGMLPSDAVSVLGRVALTSKQMAELLRVGNKLVLVAITPGGAETLTEVTDPVEVDRLMGICQQEDRFSTTKAFEQVFQQMSRDPSAGGFLGAETLPTSISPAAAAYRSHRGGSRG